MVTTPTIHIDLKLPRGWNQCTTEQLEMIAASILKHTLRQNRYHPFDWLEVKTELFFLLTGVEVSEVLRAKSDELSEQRNDDNDCTFLCRLRQQPQHRRWYHRIPLFGSKFLTRHPTPFTIKAWQVQSFITQHLTWLDDPKARPLLIFPFKRLLCVWRWQGSFPFARRHWLVPGELLQNFSWQEYRFLQDYMERYITLQNQTTNMQRGVIDNTRLAVLAGQRLEARNNFLAVLFRTGKRSLLKRINDVRWQVILFWWSGMMHYLQQQFPHCFKQSKSKGTKRPPLPIELYRNIITTVQKESNGLTEDEVNGQTFYIVLEHLERLAKQAEEMEKLNRKH